MINKSNIFKILHIYILIPCFSQALQPKLLLLNRIRRNSKSNFSSSLNLNKASPLCCSRIHSSFKPSLSRWKYFRKEQKFGNEYVPFSNICLEGNAFVASQSEDLPISIATTSKNPTTNKSKSNSNEVAPASYKAIITFLCTTVLIWLSEPILSLVDTTVLGRFSSSSSTSAVIQLAALGPATMLIDSAIYLTYFLAISTTNQLAKAIAEKDSIGQRKTISHALGIALALGFIITTTMFGFGQPMLRWIIGDGGSSISSSMDNVLMVKEAFQYVWIRSLAAPLAIMGIIAQSAALASLDTLTPFLAVLASSVTNIFGDFFFCVYPFHFGIKGAAIATAAASAVGSTVLLFSTKKRVDKLQQSESKLSVVTTTHAKDFNGLKKPEGEKISFISFPDRKSMWNLVKLAGPIFFVIAGKLVCYSSMTLRVTSLGIIPLACHNVMLRVFFFFTTFGDGLSQSAQTFLPQVLYSKKEADIDSFASNQTESVIDVSKIVDVNRQNEIDKSSSNIFQNISKIIAKRKDKNKNRPPLLTILARLSVITTIVAIINSQVSTAILKTKANLFTSETSISSLMPIYAPWIGISLFCHPFMMLFEGSIIASRDLMFLVGCYGVTILILIGQLNCFCDNFTGVWKSLFLMQFLRFIMFGSRILKRFLIEKQKKSAAN